jgi:hypothetical protein
VDTFIEHVKGDATTPDSVGNGQPLIRETTMNVTDLVRLQIRGKGKLQKDNTPVRGELKLDRKCAVLAHSKTTAGRTTLLINTIRCVFRSERKNEIS